MITKSDYLKYLQCRKYLWLHKNEPDLGDKSKNRETIFEQGYLVEEYAQKLFKNGHKVDAYPEEAKEITKKLIAEGKETIFQAAAGTENLLAIADILQYNNDTSTWDIYEVKSTTKADEQHYSDLAFQKNVFGKSGINVGRTYLVHLNGNYIKQGEIDVEKLFEITELTEEVDNLQGIVEAHIPKIQKLLQEQEVPNIQILKQCGKPYKCPFIKHCWKALPTYPVHKISRINIKKLQTLLEAGINAVKDVPADFELSDNQSAQVAVAKTNKAIVNTEAINARFEELTFPLYFLDYESFAPAIPIFEGAKSYQQVCFQYSLHTVQEDGSMTHTDYLSKDENNPIPALLKKMQNDIGPSGSVIVWHKSFEIGRNKEMAGMYPEYSEFISDLNSRVFDLKEIFSHQHYVHPGFKGSCSIKKVLPVMVPELSYEALNIQDGVDASLGWYKAVFDDEQGKEKVFEDLLKYCELDTLAMVEIYKKLK